MKHNIIRLFHVFIFFITGLLCVHAQQTVLSSGGNAAGSGTVSYSVGQAIYYTKTGTNGTINEGIQLPFEILIPEGLEDDKGITLECILYPNPTDKFVNLKIENHETGDLSFRLLDMKGTLLRNVKICNKETLIPMDDLDRATYFLVITEKEKALKTFQIIKK